MKFSALIGLELASGAAAAPVRGAVKSHATGLCVDLPGGDISLGKVLWMWECNSGDTQKWAFEDGTLKYLLDETKCVDLLGGETTNGNVLGLWNCLGAESQQWAYDAEMGTIYLASSADNVKKCVSTPSSLKQGAPLEIWDCNGETNQVWKVGELGPDISSTAAPTAAPTTAAPTTAEPQLVGKPIRSVTSNKCVDLPGGDTTNGALLQMWECIGGDTQQWSFQNNKLVYALDPNKCVDLLGGDTTNGNLLGLWDCWESESQQWAFDPEAGTIYLASSAHDASKCVRDARDSGIEIWDCNGEAPQIWQIGSMVGVAPVVVV